MPVPPPLIVVAGATATGKTELGIRLGEALIAEGRPATVISADSRQIYRGLDIGTAKATAADRARVPHAGIDLVDPDERFALSDFVAHARSVLAEVADRDGVALLVGGTGLYLRAAISDLAPPPAPAPGERERWERLYDRLGPDAAHDALARRDPDVAARLHPNDRRRVVRALEVVAAGATLRPAEDRLWSADTRLPTTIVGLSVPRDVLDRRIAERARRMVEAGVQDEARAAVARPLSSTAAKIMGLREAAELPPDEAADALAAASRRLARYQRKWMRRIPGLVTLDADRPPGEVADAILEAAVAPD
jgi:tRNA dimethylallyltransferase